MPLLPSIAYCSLYAPNTRLFCFFFFFNDTATTEIYTLSLHDALPISSGRVKSQSRSFRTEIRRRLGWRSQGDRKSTRLNSSHLVISYAVFCLKKKKKYDQRSSLRDLGDPRRQPIFDVLA